MPNETLSPRQMDEAVDAAEADTQAVIASQKSHATLLKPYLVNVTTVAVVMAKDEHHAKQVTRECHSEICEEDPHPEIVVGEEVLVPNGMPHLWDGDCIPYGGDGNTRLSELLAQPAQSGKTAV